MQSVWALRAHPGDSEVAARGYRGLFLTGSEPKRDAGELTTADAGRATSRRTALHEISSPKCLQNTFEEIWRKSSRRGRRGSGIDGESLQDFWNVREQRSHELSETLRSKEGYRFHGLLAYVIPKDNGKDRVVQRAILKFLLTKETDRCKLRNDVNYGFLRERGVATAVNKAVNFEIRILGSTRLISPLSSIPFPATCSLSESTDSFAFLPCENCSSEQRNARSKRWVVARLEE